MTATPTAIITGGAAGIGYAIAAEFAQKGYQVAIVDRDSALVESAAQRLTQVTGARIISAAADVTHTEQCEEAYKHIEAEFGAVAVLVNNAGIMPPVKGRIEELPADDFQQMMNVHVGGTVNWCRLVIPGMRAVRFGRIINMSSVNAVQPVPYRSAYVTVKKAIRGLTEALALECARAGITVNAIAPGLRVYDARQTSLPPRHSLPAVHHQRKDNTPVYLSPFAAHPRQYRLTAKAPAPENPRLSRNQVALR
jgi:NAD(P)-dependent dehydrogenase (short-subunit alcohol dehydrogenase family)